MAMTNTPAHGARLHLPLMAHGWRAMLLLAAAAMVFASLSPVHASMDMPSDPVSGEMVMSTAYNFKLKNGQRLRFANAETLQRFEAHPEAGIGHATNAEAASAEMSASALCPVCGMQTAMRGGPLVTMRHGEQVIHTCSLGHAHQVADDVRSFQVVSSEEDGTIPDQGDGASHTHAFCLGSGTTMLNGFSFFQSGNDSGGDGDHPCILLWFPGWVLNTAWRYVLGCLMVVLLAVFSEYLLHLRRVLRKESNWKRLHRVNAVDNAQAESNGNSNSNSMSMGMGIGNGSTERSKLLRGRTASAQLVTAPSTDLLPTWFRGLEDETQHVVHCVLHGVTILLAYMLMLVSMTYDGVLLLCCIAGYIVGHYIFGERREAVQDVEAMSLP